jgi:amino acid adenylation domain-containing protein
MASLLGSPGQGNYAAANASINFPLPTELMQGLKAQGQSQGATLYVILLAAFQVLLHRLSAQDDILVGSPTMGRNRSEFEEIFGYFVNPIVLRASFEGNPSFNTFLQQVRQTVLNGLAHQDYPFPELVKHLQPHRDASRSPLFQVLFVMQKLEKDNVASLFLSGDFDENGDENDNEKRRVEQAGLTLAPFKMAQQEGQFDLSLEMIEAQGSLSGNLRYNTDLFDGQTIERMVGHFQQLLESIVLNPDLPVSDLTLLTEKEQHQLLVDWNDTKADYPSDQCIHQWVEAQVEATPDAIAVVCDAQQMTYGELNSKANQLAHHLQSTLGLKTADSQDLLVGICIERSIEMVIGILAILKAGGAYIPIDPSYPAERLAFMLEDAGMQVLITKSSLKEKLPAISNHSCIPSKATPKIVYLALETDTLSQASTTNPSVDVGPNNLIYIIYTSGSTGQPKSVAVYHQGFTNLIHWFVNTFEVTAADRALVVSPSSFDLTQKNIFAPLVRGGQLHLLPQTYYEPDLISNIVAAQKISWINCASSAFYPLIEANAQTGFEKLASMRYVFLGGEPISIKTLWPWLQSKACQVKVVNPYGPSECTDVCAAYITEHPEQFLDKSLTALPIGKPVDNAQMYILGKHLELLPIGVAGEIHIGGVGVGRGYLNNPQMTAEKFISNPFITATTATTANSRLYKTGDLARYLPDGNIQYLGRIDKQVKVRGFRIELGEIEAALVQHPQVDKVVVMVREDQPGNPRIVAYLIPIDDAGLKSDQLRAFLKAKLPEFMVPSAFVTLEAFVLSANGKIDFRALPRPTATATSRSATRELSLPQTEIEQKMATIWQEVLDIETVGIHDNFFELGGHSLLLVQLQSKLKKAFCQEIAIVELFEHPTIQTLALHLGQATQENPLSRRADVKVEGRSEGNGEIAIIGMSARLPGADDTDSYWQNLKNGVESVTFFSDEELLSSGIDEETLSRPNYVKAAAVLSDIDAFDASFFDISPAEAQMTDPQHRLFLECAWQAMENAGYEAGTIEGTDEHTIGVFGGAALNTYLINNLSASQELNDMVDIFKVMIGNSNDFLTTRTSYKLNLTGPSINVQTACSTSLVAVNLACDSLRKGDCDIALAGGVSVRVPHKNGYLYQEGMILSPDGHCRPFDAQAKGIVGGNGVGIVVLKRLDSAIADGDNVLAVIKGSATNNDGGLKMNFSAPSVAGQANVIAQAQASAGVDPQTIGYIEAHGTGTELGDPIEIAALNKVFGQNQKNAYGTGSVAKGSVAIGSVKSNIGHTDSAAGIASLIKTVLCLQHKQLPPSLHFEQPNPQIDFSSSPFYVNNTLSQWKTKEGVPRRAGVSSFGIGGTNAHAILEEAPVRTPSGPSRPWQLMVLSAKTPSALETATSNLATHLALQPEVNLADVAYTLSKGRKPFNHRRILIGQQLDEVSSALHTLEPSCVFTQAHKEKPALAFMFSGQGSQTVNMGLEVYQTEPVFQKQVDFCADYLKPLLGCDLREVLYPKEQSKEQSKEQGKEQTDEATNPLNTSGINETALTQAALFVTEYALAKLWMSWGVYPEAMIGHSIGEYVAACLSEVFSLEDALTLVAARGQLMQSVTGDGAMLAVPLAEKDVKSLLSQGLSIAAINTPTQCVVAGPTELIAAFEAQLLEKQNIERRTSG